MEDWTYGYVTEVPYTYGYYAELNPLKARFALLYKGFSPPEFMTACELGFGQGLSLNLHAASQVIEWYGTDFNPEHAVFAKELAEVSGSGVKIFDEAFSEFCSRKDLPDFDFIGLHGVWTWINEENRRIIVDFVKRKLKLGGVLYISYNVLPGWNPVQPLRYLLIEHKEMLGAKGQSLIDRFNAALEFVERLFSLNPLFVKANPQIIERLKRIKELNRNYLVHEYFTRDWHPMYFSEMAGRLKMAKLQYACSAHFLDFIEAINLTSEQQAFLRELTDPIFREQVRDFMVNQQFRRDYWVKGARRLSPFERAERLRNLRVILVVPPSDVSFKVRGALGEATLNESIYRPLLEFMSDYKIKTIGQIEQALKARGLTFDQVVEAVMVLVGTGTLALAQEESVIAKAKKHTDRLNLYLCQQARVRSEIIFLASPVTGGGIPVNRFQQLFLLARNQGYKTPSEWAEFVWKILEAQGSRIIKEGKVLETPEENLRELNSQAESFSEKTLPILKALQIA